MKKIIGLVLMFVCVLNTVGCTSQKEYIYVDFLDVGNADCIVIRTENRTTVIDTATSISSNIIFKYLNEKGIDRIDVLIITHFDKDHVGSASKILNNIQVDRVYQTYKNSGAKSQYYKRYLKSLKNNKTDVYTLTEPKKMFQDDAILSVYPPESDGYITKESNNSSLIVTLEYGIYSFFFGGDIEEDRIAEILRGGTKKFDVLKVPHHGYYEDNTGEFISEISPKFSVITTTSLSPPSPQTVMELYRIGSKVYFTDNGTVEIITDGESFSVKQNK